MGYVLVVDDDPAVRDVVAGALVHDGYDVRTASDGLGALAAVGEAPPDLVVLDQRLPDIDGVVVVSRLRPDYPGPILICSGVTDERARIQALDAGADDYMVKPFGVAELRRLRALQRRSPASRDAVLRMDGLEVDVAGRALRVGGEERRLTRTQWRILTVLVERPGELVTFRRLAQRVWGDRSGEEARETLRAHVRSLRRAIGDSADEQRYLRTEPGVGYRWLARPGNGDLTPGEHVVDGDLLHELGNVLTALQFETHRLREQVAGSDRSGETTARLEALVERAARLAVDLGSPGQRKAPSSTSARPSRRPSSSPCTTPSRGE